MRQAAKCTFVGTVVSIAAAVAGCSSTEPGDQESDPVAVSQSELIQAKDCVAAQQHGRVGLCHATGRPSHPYLFERVLPLVCARIHARHRGDFISNDSSCPVCGNGIVEHAETCDPAGSCPTSCDDGNACTTDNLSGSAATCNASCTHTPISACASGDGCCPAGCTSSTDADCAPPPCTQILTLKKLRFWWLGRSCNATEPQTVVFTVNEQEVARVPLANDCTCTPGVASVDITDPALLGYGKNGVNVFRATTNGTLSWATVEYETPEFGGETTIWAAWPFETWGDATAHPQDLCVAGSQDVLDLSGLAMNLGGGVSCN